MASIPPSDLQTILIDRLSPGAVLFTYNQPHISNAFTLQQYLDLRTALLWARDEPSIRVVVQTGKGKHYCAGKALSSPSSSPSPNDPTTPTVEQELDTGGKLGETLATFPRILIAAVNGAAIGWGCTQLHHFDLVYTSAQRAFFQMPFLALGTVPEGGSSWSFPRTMGRQRANGLLLAGERYGAREMWVAGLVTRVIEGEEFLEQVCEKAREIAGWSGEALGMAKALTRTAREAEESMEAKVRESEEMKEAMKEAMRRFAGKSGEDEAVTLDWAKKRNIRTHFSTEQICTIVTVDSIYGFGRSTEV